MEEQGVKPTVSQVYNAYKVAWQKNRYSTDPCFRQRLLDRNKASRDRKAALAPPKEPRPPPMTKTERYQADEVYRERVKTHARRPMIDIAASLMVIRRSTTSS